MESTHAAGHASGLIAESMLRRRRTRDAVFEGYGDGFGEPAWDALLLLFSAHAQGRPSVTITDVVEETHKSVRTTTAFVGWLETQDLVRSDGESVTITDRGQRLMEQYLATVVGDEGDEGVSI